MSRLSVVKRKYLLVNIECRCIVTDENLFFDPSPYAVAAPGVAVVILCIGHKIHAVIDTDNVIFVFIVELLLLCLGNNIVRRCRNVAEVRKLRYVVPESSKRYYLCHF